MTYTRTARINTMSCGQVQRYLFYMYQGEVLLHLQSL